MSTLKKLKRIVQKLEQQDCQHPDWLYLGDFVRCNVDGEIYIVTVRWDNEARVYKWNLISLDTGLPLEGIMFDDWVSSELGGQINRNKFWEDSDQDWEVINLDDKEAENE